MALYASMVPAMRATGIAPVLWLMGGWDGTRYYNDVWCSPDAVHWTRVAEHAAWSARNTMAVVFRNKIWILGGGVIDGTREINPNSSREVPGQ